MSTPRLLEVPEDVARIAAAALARRDQLQGGGTARGVVIATALCQRVITTHERDEIVRWHERNPNAAGEAGMTLAGGLYGGLPARLTWEPRTAAALNPEGKGAMIALPVPPEIAQHASRPDGEPVDAMHVTLFSLGSDASALDPAARDRLRTALATFTANADRPRVNLTHVERFTSDTGMEPAVLVDSGPSVPALREQLQQILDGQGVDYADDHAFRTHMTLGYYPEGEGPTSGQLDSPYDWQPDALELHWGEDVDAFPFAEPSDSFTAAVRAPIANRLAKLSATLNDTDRKLRLRLHAAAEVALTEALRQAAVKVNVKARTAKQKAMVAAAQGSLLPILAAVGVSEQELLDKRFDTLEAAAAVWILAAERRKLRALGTALGLDPADLDREYDDEMTSRATAAAGFLALGLGIVARSALSGTQPPTQGEQSGPVPFGLVRDTMILGSSRTPPPTIDESGTGPAAIDAISQRLTRTGETLAQELLAREGLDTVTTYTWRHGDPTKDFIPHADLEGTRWAGDNYPEEVFADPGEWPFVDRYEPQDHDYCTCWYDEELAPVEAAADVLV